MSGAAGIDVDAGTDEGLWHDWAAPLSWPRLTAAEVAPQDAVVVVLAAHPDDEVLGVGGLLALLARCGREVRLVWATDGEASHPGSRAPLVGRLPEVRRDESAEAARRLGLGGAPRTHLGLPDGGLAERVEEIAGHLAPLVPEGAVLLAPWAGDGHPDHEACGRAAGRVPAGRLLEYPVWAWHWATPEDPRVPWGLARRVDLDADARDRKSAAVAAFGSQVAPIGPAPEDGPVLPEPVLAHFRRPYEVLLERFAEEPRR